MERSPLPAVSRIDAPPAGQVAFPFGRGHGVRQTDDFPRALEQPEVLLDLDDNRRRAVGELMALQGQP
jgi:hypothetical protein